MFKQTKYMPVLSQSMYGSMVTGKHEINENDDR